MAFNKKQIICLWIGVAEFFIWILLCIDSKSYMRLFWPVLIWITGLTSAMIWTVEKESRLKMWQIVVINLIIAILVIIFIEGSITSPLSGRK